MATTKPSHALVFTCLLICTTIIGWLFVQLREILVPILLTLVLWFILNGIAKWLEQIKVHNYSLPRWLSMLLSTAIVVYIGFFSVGLITANLAEFAQDSNQYSATIKNLIVYINTFLPSPIPEDINAFIPEIKTSQLVQWGGNLLSDFSSFSSLVLIYLVFFFTEQANFSKKFTALFKNHHNQSLASEILGNINSSIGMYTRIMLIINFLQGLLTYMALVWLGIDYPAFWGFMTFIFNFIPTIGTIISILFPVMMAIVQTGDPIIILMTLLLLSCIQLILGTIIGPKLLGNSLNLSSLVVMFSLAIWGAAWGVIGMFLAVPITVMIMIICANFESTEKIAILLSDNGDISAMKPNRDAIRKKLNSAKTPLDRRFS
jgi:predicted PurR-regulated permease PerM